MEALCNDHIWGSRLRDLFMIVHPVLFVARVLEEADGAYSRLLVHVVQVVRSYDASKDPIGRAWTGAPA